MIAARRALASCILASVAAAVAVRSKERPRRSAWTVMPRLERPISRAIALRPKPRAWSRLSSAISASVKGIGVFPVPLRLAMVTSGGRGKARPLRGGFTAGPVCECRSGLPARVEAGLRERVRSELPRARAARGPVREDVTGVGDAVRLRSGRRLVDLVREVEALGLGVRAVVVAAGEVVARSLAGVVELGRVGRLAGGCLGLGVAATAAVVLGGCARGERECCGGDSDGVADVHGPPWNGWRTGDMMPAVLRLVPGMPDLRLTVRRDGPFRQVVARHAI